MFALLVELNALPAAAGELEEVLVELARLAGEEAGNVLYAVNRAQDDPASFVLYELYQDRAAWEAHLAIEAVQRALQQFERLLAAPRVVRCDSVAVVGVTRSA